jgi:hypothetical protein
MQRKNSGRFSGSRWSGLRERCWKLRYNSSLFFKLGKQIRLPFFFVTICLMRRSVQSCVEISRFPLDESGFPSAVNNTFLSFRIRDKSCHERGAK